MFRRDVNRFPFLANLILNNGTQTRLNPNFGAIIYGRTIGRADGQLRNSHVEQSGFTHSWQLRGIYTFGKATGRHEQFGQWDGQWRGGIY